MKLLMLALLMMTDVTALLEGGTAVRVDDRLQITRPFSSVEVPTTATAIVDVFYTGEDLDTHRLRYLMSEATTATAIRSLGPVNVFITLRPVSRTESPPRDQNIIVLEAETADGATSLTQRTRAGETLAVSREFQGDVWARFDLSWTAEVPRPGEYGIWARLAPIYPMDAFRWTVEVGGASFTGDLPATYFHTPEWSFAGSVVLEDAFYPVKLQIPRWVRVDRLELRSLEP